MPSDKKKNKLKNLKDRSIEENNNVKNLPDSEAIQHLNNNTNDTISNSSIINYNEEDTEGTEEFDISDNDLLADDSDSENISIKAITSEHLLQEQAKSEEQNPDHNQYQEQPIKATNGSLNGNVQTSLSDNGIIDKNIDSVDKNSLVLNGNQHSEYADDIPIDTTLKKKTNISSQPQKSPSPSNLTLTSCSDLSNDDQIALQKSDSFCPITPRRIVDSSDNDDVPIGSPNPNDSNNLLKPNDVKSLESENHNDYDDNPDDELLVQFLGEANPIAEARLAARRQARAEAREIRMRELERQQKEQEQNADRVFDMHTSSSLDPLARTRLTSGLNSLGSPISSILYSARANSMSSRRSSEDSLEEESRSLRDIRQELKDVEERFRKAMIANAQLDNERASQTYQIQLLKDKLEEMEESFAQLQREFKEKTRECNQFKRNMDKLNEELKLVHGQLTERDTLIQEQGLIIVNIENDDGTDAKRALVSMENAQLLGSVQGSLDVRLKKFSEEKQQLSTEVQKLQEQLDTYKSQGKGRGSLSNGPVNNDDDYDAQREANKIISDYKYKLQKAEQEIANLQACLARSETQVIRYKSTAEAAEKAEAELKIERRKLQRENREALERLEELEISNNQLLKRLDKLKNAKSALLKEL